MKRNFVQHAGIGLKILNRIALYAVKIQIYKKEKEELKAGLEFKDTFMRIIMVLI